MLKPSKLKTAVALSGHLGDVVLYSCVLKPLRDLFPNDEITLIVSEPARQLFGQSPYADRFMHIDAVTLGPWRWLKFSRREGLANRTRRLWAPTLKVDRLIFPYHFVSRRNFSILDTVQRREMVGCINGRLVHTKRSEYWKNSITHPFRIPSSNPPNHVLDNIAEFLRQIGPTDFTADQLVIELPILETDRASARSAVEEFGGQPYGVIFPGGNFMAGMKLWPPDRYVEVISRLGTSAPRNWVTCGSVEEQQVCADLAQSLKALSSQIQAITICGMPFRVVAALLEEASLVIGNDNGGMHMAIACGAPTVSIVGGMTPHLYQPWGDPLIHRAVTYPMACWGCEYRCTQTSVMCVDNITAKTVTDSCLAVLAAYQEQRRA